MCYWILINDSTLGIACPDMSYISLFSSMFMHGGLIHLGGNMLFLWIFGDNIELKFGKAKFLNLSCMGVGAGLVSYCN